MSSEQVRVLVVDDDEAMREVLQMRLEEWGYQVVLAEDAFQAREMVGRFDPDVVVSDVVMPELSGIELLPKLKGERPDRPVILLTAHGSVEMAVEAMKLGAQDFITKPLDYSKLQSVLEAACEERKLRSEEERIAAKLRKGERLGRFVGSSSAMKEVYSLIRSLASSDASVMITGESGTGKELVARTIHELSLRSEGPFIAVNSAAIPSELMESEIFGHEKGAFTGAAAVRQGCFELADGGTLFLDEISEMPPALQPKLLRVLEDGRVRRLGGKREFQFDVRILTATNRDPHEAVQEGLLRQDLFFRLNVFTVALPPLRVRREDIRLLGRHFVEEFRKKHRVKAPTFRRETLELLDAYDWPGNVRELRNVIERAVILAQGEWIEPSHLPPYVRRKQVSVKGKLVLPVGVTAAEAERELILRTLEETGNNKTEAARRLGLDVKTIRNKLKAWESEKDETKT